MLYASEFNNYYIGANIWYTAVILYACVRCAARWHCRYIGPPNSQQSDMACSNLLK